MGVPRSVGALVLEGCEQATKVLATRATALKDAKLSVKNFSG